MNPVSLLVLLVPLVQAAPRAGAPAAGEEVEVVQVVSGDTLRVRRANGQQEELHLLSVDAEEPTSGRASDGSKPTTAFGEETVHWLRTVLHERSERDGRPRVSMLFSDGERRDVYGRLLSHASLLDGTDLSLLLVEQGKSPYYTKYGYSTRLHEALTRAQERARAARRGIWAPVEEASTRERDERRPYPQLIAWWNARAEAVQAFRAAAAKEPETVLEGEDPDALARAAEYGQTVELFVEPLRIDTLEGKPPQLVLRSAHRGRPLVVRLDDELRQALLPLAIEERIGTFRQNYLWLTGRIVRERDAWRLSEIQPARCRVAGPEPVLAPAERR